MMIFNQPETQNNISYLTLPDSKVNKVSDKAEYTDNLLFLLKQKNERGFSLLYDNYADALFSVIFQIVNNIEISEDLLQETFVKIWKKIDTYDEVKGTIYTWMLNIARNTGIDYIRSQKNQFYKQLVHDDKWQNEYSQPGAIVGITDRLDFIAIKNRIGKLEEKYSIIVDLIYFEGYTY